MRKAIFLDRDGVINSYVYNPDFGTIDSPSTPDQFQLIPGVGDAVATLNRLGFLIVVISNQPGIAKEKFTPVLLEQVTAKMRDAIAECGGKLDAIYYCLHHPEASLPAYRMRCECRKPRPGLLLQAARELNIDMKSAYMIGDGITDIQAGIAAGTKTIYIGQRKEYVMDAFEKHCIQPDCVVPSLAAAVAVIEKQISEAEILDPAR